jgi:hypothetical protein
MTYEPNKLTEKASVQENATIQSIEEGTAGEMRPDSYWSKFEGDKQELAEAKKAPVIRVTASNGAALVISLPKNGVVHPKSTLARFKKTYKKYPEQGMQVTTIPDENGFQRIMLVS